MSREARGRRIPASLPQRAQPIGREVNFDGSLGVADVKVFSRDPTSVEEGLCLSMQMRTVLVGSGTARLSPTLHSDGGVDLL